MSSVFQQELQTQLVTRQAVTLNQTMRVQFVLSLVSVVAITYAVETTSSTGGSPIELLNEPALDSDDGDRAMNIFSLFRSAKNTPTRLEPLGVSQLDKSFKRLLDRNDDALMKRLSFLLFVEEADELAEKHVKSTLELVFDSFTRHLNDKRIAELIYFAKKHHTNEAIANALEKIQKKHWMENGLTAVEAATLLGMDSAKYHDLPSHPLFNYWRSYVESLDGGKKQIAEISQLALQDKKVIAKTSPLSLQDKKAKRIAKLVQAEQVETWTMNGWSLEEVFTYLKLDRAGSKLLEDPLVNLFAEFTKSFNARRERDLEAGRITTKNKETSSLSIRKRGPGDFVEINYAPGVEFGLTESEKALFQLWFASDTHPSDIFKLYLAEAEDNLLRSPLFTTFLKYVNTYTLNKQKDVSVFPIIYKHYKAGGPALVNEMLAVEKSLNTPAKLAAEKVKHDMFYGRQNPFDPRSPDDIFSYLKLDEVTDPAELFQSHLFEFWMKYLNIFIHYEAGAKSISRTYLVTGYDADALLLAIAKAKRNDETKEMAMNLEIELFFKQYAFAKKSPIDIHALLERHKMLESHKSLFKSYVKDLREITQETPRSKEPKLRRNDPSFD